MIDEQNTKRAVQDGRSAGREQPATPVEHHRCGDDRHEVEKGERRVERASEVNEKRLDEQIAGELDGQIDFSRTDDLPGADVDQRESIGDRRRRVDIVDRQDLSDGVLNEERGQEQRGDSHHADRDQHSGVRGHVGR